MAATSSSLQAEQTSEAAAEYETPPKESGLVEQPSDEEDITSKTQDSSQPSKEQPDAVESDVGTDKQQENGEASTSADL